MLCFSLFLSLQVFSATVVWRMALKLCRLIESCMNENFPVLGILSSMITPAVLILASGSLITTTSQRLSRVIDRVRKISQEVMQAESSISTGSATEEKRRTLYTLLEKSA